MIPKIFTENIDLGDGRTITIETGKLAKQADGSVVVRSGNTLLLATVVSSKKTNLDIDFLPLTIDYREKFASSGRFPGGFFKREARPSDGEVLTMRLVDRALRPLFPKDYHAETQVMIQLMSHDEDIMPDAMVGLAASACIALSDIPFECEISEVRVGRIDEKFIINPSREELSKSNIDIMVGATIDSITMVEGEMKEISEKELTEAIKVAHEAIKLQCIAQQNLVEKTGGKKPTRTYDSLPKVEGAEEKIKEQAYKKFYDIAKTPSSKEERSKRFSEVTTEVNNLFSEEDLAKNTKQIGLYTQAVQKEAIRNLLLEEGIRLDGRKSDEIRPIWCEVNYLPSTHGSAIFTRGETQALATVTLGTSREVNIIDMPSNQSEDKFYLHYNFPPFSTGEARPLRGTSRREVGHGNLAQRALKGVIPENCPYTIRIVSEILESNGSSSMATVCAGTLALMDAGVQIERPVSGIAMGLISDGKKFTVLSDILGDEDHLGDMDFKVTGTQKGITACQMDIKIKGLTYEILEMALEQSKKGRLHILDKLVETLSAPCEEVKLHAPKILKVEIPKEYIGAVIGPSGKNIQALQEETGTTVVINEIDDMGIVEIMGVDPEGMQKALQSIKNSTFELKEGETYTGKVIKMLDFGAVLEFVPGKECLLHISEIAHERIENVTDVINMGDKVEVKYLGIDSRTRKQKISRKALLTKT